MIGVWTICAILASALAHDSYNVIVPLEPASSTAPSTTTEAPTTATTTSTTTPAPMPDTTPLANPIPVTHVAKCGGRPYFAYTHICCAGRVSPKLNAFTKCCGKYRYDSRHMFCCGEDLVMSDYKKCCDDVVYDPRKLLCCRGSLRKKKKPDDYCCGSRVCHGRWA